MPDQHRARSLVFHPNAPAVVRFEPFRFDLADGSLWRDSTEIRLPPRALVILQHLVERAGRIVAKQALIEAAWKDAYVSDASLTEVIGILRQALNDDPQQPRYIQTVHRRGYRFIAPIAVDAPAAPPLAIERAAPADAAIDDAPSDVAAPELAAPDVARQNIAAHDLARDVAAPDIAARHAAEPDVPAAARTARVPRSWWFVAAAAAIGLAIVAAIGFGVASWLRPRGAASGPPVVRLSLTLPADQAPNPSLNAHPVAALTPDGERVVYVAGTTESSRLYVRRMDQFSATPVLGTDGAHGPFISPNGEWIAFFAGGALKKVRLDGGQPHVLCTTPTGVGGTWLTNDEIVFAPDWTSPLMRVSADGGTPTIAATPPTGHGYRWPDRLDDRTILATRWKTSVRDSAVVAIALPSGAETIIAEGATFGRTVRTQRAGVGHVLFVRSRAVHAVRIDPSSGKPSGGPVQVVDTVLMGSTGAAQLAIAPNGTLIYIGDTPERTHRLLARVDRTGHMTDLPVAKRGFRSMGVCGDRLAVTAFERGQADLWIGHVDRAALTRLTNEGITFEPVWKPGCSTLTFSWNRGGVSTIYEVDPVSGAPPRPVPDTRVPGATPVGQAPGSWSADGRFLAYMQDGGMTDLWVLDASSRTIRPVVATPADEILPRLSPDGRWLSYESDVSGTFEIEVASVETGARVQVSHQGGTWPYWSSDGRQLFYLDDGTIYRVAVAERHGEFVAGNPVVVFSHPDIILFRPVESAGREDGFVVFRRTAEHLPLTRLDLVLNFLTELQAAFR